MYKRLWNRHLEVGGPPTKQSSCWPLQRKAYSETSLLTILSTCCGSFNRNLSSDCWWEKFVVWAESCRLIILPFSCWGDFLWRPSRLSCSHTSCISCCQTFFLVTAVWGSWAILPCAFTGINPGEALMFHWPPRTWCNEKCNRWQWPLT